MPSGRFARRALLVALTAALFAGVFLLRIVHPQPNDPITLFYVVPIAIIATEFGLASGLAAAALALALFGLWELNWGDGGNAYAYLTRGSAFFLLGVSGFLSNRMRRTSRESDRFFSLSLDLLCTVGLDGCFKRLNPAWATLGWSVEEMLGRPFISFVHPDDVERTRAEAAKLGSGEWQTVSFENRYRCRDGSYRWILWSASASVEDGLLYGAAKDITERKAVEEKFRVAEERFHGVFDASPIGIALVNEASRFEQVNEAFCRLTGFTREELGSRTTVDLTHPDDLTVMGQLLDQLVSGKVPSFRVENRYLTKSGGVVWTSTTASLLRDGQGRPLHVIRMVEDITERKRFQDDLAVARDQALEASRVKSEFMANMSHEIRTPLNGVIGMSEMLLEAQLTDDQRYYAEIVRTSGEALLAVVNDVLDFSKTEAGKLELDETDFRLDKTVEEVTDLIAALGNAKGVEVVTLVDEDVPRMVRGDAVRVRQVLANLMDNAVKFTNEGDVALRVRCTEADEDELLIRFEVNDTGIGIETEQIDRLFGAFEQADSSSTRTRGGTGLGLAISRRLTEMMGGEMGVESELGRGSCFWFTARLGVAKSDVEPAAGETVSLSGLRALIVDDNSTNRSVLCHHLASWGVEVASARDAAEAIRALRETAAAGKPHDFAILDYNMPGVNGLDLGRTISSDPLLSSIRLLMLTSVGDQRAEFRAAGIEVCINKPVRRAQLMKAVEAVMAGAASNGVGPEGPPAESGNSAGPVGPKILVVEDNLVNQKVAEVSLTNRGYRVDIANDGREALERIAANRYAAVVMDCQMPHMDGYEATAEIRRLEGSERRTPIIALTSHSITGDREKCLSVGMDDYLTKPVRPEALGAVMARWAPIEPASDAGEANGELRVEISVADERAVGPPTEGSTPAVELRDDVLIDESIIEDLLVSCGQRGLVAIVDIFVSDTPILMSEISEAVSRRDDDALRRAAHTLKGCAANLGGNRLAALSGRLERAAGADFDAAAELVAQLEAAFEQTHAALYEMAGAPVASDTEFGREQGKPVAKGDAAARSS